MESCGANARSPSPPPVAYNMLELDDGGGGVYFYFLYNGSRFFVHTSAADLGQGELLKRLDDFRGDLDNPDAMYAFEDWIFDALEAFLPPFGDRNPRTLLEYYSPPTFAFKMVNQGGRLHPIQQDYDPRIYRDTSPRTRIVDTPPDATSTEFKYGYQGVVSRSALPPIPLIPASQIERVVDETPDTDLMDTPRKVRRVGSDGPVFLFKPASNAHGHLRELEVLSRIHQSEKYAPPLRTSRLVGLVVWDHDTKPSPDAWMGFLMEYVEGKTLEGRIFSGASAESKVKWIRQVQATVEQLHRDGIVWGDVKPDNVLINEGGDAVVIDFGGGYIPEYMPRELQQTMEGDLMGLRRMAEEMDVPL